MAVLAGVRAHRFEEIDGRATRLKCSLVEHAENRHKKTITDCFPDFKA